MVSNDNHWIRILAVADVLHWAQGEALGFLGLGPRECNYRVVALGSHWRVRTYADTADRGLTVLIVSAPIKRPYIWDLAPTASAISYCLRLKVQIYLTEWIPPCEGDDDIGLDE